MQSARTDAVASSGVLGRARSRSRRRAAERRTMWAMLAPSVALLILINGYPLAVAVWQSVHDGTLLTSGEFVGLQNYTTAFTDPLFWGAVWFTLAFAVAGVFGSWVVGLAFALILRNETPGRSAFRVLLLLPWVVPIVCATTSWNWLLGTYSSPLVSLCRYLFQTDVLFLADPTLARITVCVLKIWLSYPFMMLMTAAALESIDDSLYEAARMDGANRRQMLFEITLPLISRPTYIAWILMAIFSINDFSSIFLLTGGGPYDSTQTLVVLAYRLAFQNFEIGYAVAVAFFTAALMVLVSLILFRQLRRSSAT